METGVCAAFSNWHGDCNKGVGKIAKTTTMNPLTFQPILSNLSEAHVELAQLFARLQFHVFGEVVDESVKEWAETVAQDERTGPLDERALCASLVRAYRHLNIAWNCRHATEERVRRCAPDDFQRWSRFPDDAIFRDLWPAPSRCRGISREPVRGHITPSSYQAAFLHMAVRKLGILCYRISYALGTDYVPRPKGLRPGMETGPFTEEEFGRRMHRIYSDMNFAWTCRTYRKGGESLARQAIRRRQQFPRVFLSAPSAATADDGGTAGPR